MNSNRILSRHGNVIAADFTPRATDLLSVEIKSEILYLDHLVCLTRFTLLLGGAVIATRHFTAFAPTA